MKKGQYGKIAGIERVHFIGICGVAMGTLAGMMKEIGYAVTGSDEHVYPPMSDMLRAWGISAYEGFSEKHIGNADLVIIGNAISRGNVEAEYVLNKGMPYCSLASALQTFFLRQREVIAVAGTHGKTTTTAALSHILNAAGEDPSFFVGGVPINYNSNYRLGKGRFFVIEADEYDSAFFEKVPKFMFYRPRHCVFTSLEFDHADIFKDLEEIKLWFRRLINTIPSEGDIVYSREYPALKDVMQACRSKRHSFGTDGADFVCVREAITNEMTVLSFRHSGGEGELVTPLFGAFNYQNICAAAAMAFRLGIPFEHIREGVRTFRGVKRRQELLYDGSRVKIFEDFAHHPTAIAQVIGAMRERFQEAAIIAAYEPRSATSRRNVFQTELPAAFDGADLVCIKKPFKIESIPETERIDAARVIDDIAKRGIPAKLYDDVDSIVSDIRRGFDATKRAVVVIMSNGGFDGIYGKMVAAAKEWEERAQVTVDP